MINYIREKFHPLWRLRQSRLFRGLQKKCDPDFSIRIAEIKVSVKLLRDAGLILYSGHESESKEIFINILKKNNIQLFFDVGANIGSYSWIAIANDIDEVFLFEPDTTNQRLIMKTLRNNSIENGFLIPCALSEDIGVSEFIVDIASGATGSLKNFTNDVSSWHSAYGMNTTDRVLTLPLDTFTGYAQGKKVFVKIDVEGAEEKVFQGGSKFFEEVMPFVLVECFDDGCLDFFINLGYSIKPLLENCNYLLSPPIA